MKPSTAQQAIAKLKPSDGLTFKLVTESELEGSAVGYKAGFMDAKNAAIAAIEAELAQPAQAVYLVATGEITNGMEQYTRHDNLPPMCDYEKLYTTPQKSTGIEADAQPVEQVAWNKNIRDSVDSLLFQAGYAKDSSARHQLSMMNFDAVPQEPAGRVLVPMTKDQRRKLLDKAGAHCDGMDGESWDQIVIDAVEAHHSAKLAAKDAS